MTCPESHGGEAGVTRSAGVLFPRECWDCPARWVPKLSVQGADHQLRCVPWDPYRLVPLSQGSPLSGVCLWGWGGWT